MACEYRIPIILVQHATSSASFRTRKPIIFVSNILTNLETQICQNVSQSKQNSLLPDEKLIKVSDPSSQTFPIPLASSALDVRPAHFIDASAAYACVLLSST